MVACGCSITSLNMMLRQDAQNRLLAPLAPLGEHYYSNAEEMHKAGFSACKTLLQFQESFCATREQRQLHREIVVEAAKESIGNAHFYWMSDETPQGYLSPLLEKLRQERIARGEAFATRDPLKPWLVEFDCCRRAEVELQYTRSIEYRARRSSYLDELRRLLVRDSEVHATALSLQLDPMTFEKPLRVKLCKEILAQVTRPYGFELDRQRSSRSAIVFSKSFVADWALSWIIDPANLFNPTGTRLEDQVGRLHLSLELRDASVKGLLFDEAAHQGHCIPIAYEAVAPLASGGHRVYGTFCSPPELETALRAHLFFYAQIAAAVEDILASGLESELNPPPDRIP